MRACTHKQAFLSCTVAVSNRRTVLTLMHIYRHAHSFNSVSSIIGRQPWLFFCLFVPNLPSASHTPLPFFHPPHFLLPSFPLCPPFPLSLTPVSPFFLSLSPCQFSECQWKVLLSADISNHSPGRQNYGHTFNVWGQSRTWAESKVEHKGNFSLSFTCFHFPLLSFCLSLTLDSQLSVCISIYNLICG